MRCVPIHMHVDRGYLSWKGRKGNVWGRVDLNSIFVSPSLGSRDRFKSSMRLDLYYKLGSTTSLLYLVLSNRELPTQRTKTSDQLDASDLELSSTSRSLSLSPIVDSLGP